LLSLKKIAMHWKSTPDELQMNAQIAEVMALATTRRLELGLTVERN
jgi:hypothetical protein